MPLVRTTPLETSRRFEYQAEVKPCLPKQLLQRSQGRVECRPLLPRRRLYTRTESDHSRLRRRYRQRQGSGDIPAVAAERRSEGRRREPLVLYHPIRWQSFLSTRVVVTESKFSVDRGIEPTTSPWHSPNHSAPAPLWARARVCSCRCTGFCVPRVRNSVLHTDRRLSHALFDSKRGSL